MTKDRLHGWVSVGIAVPITTPENAEVPGKIIGLGFPKKEPDPDDPTWDDPDNFEDFFLTPDAARELVIALKDVLYDLEGGE